MQFLDFTGLSEFLKGLFAKFSEIGHKHTTSDITDYVVDSSLSSTSTNPLQNKAINSALSGKVPTSRTINGKALTGNISLSASDVGADAAGTATTKANAVQANVNTLSDEVSDHVENADIHFTAAERTKLSGIATGANKYSHPSSGVTAGTYKSVTVNAQGHVTGGTNPTTLAGYGITDAASASDLDELAETVSGKANSSHTHTIANVTNLQSSLDAINDEIDGSIKELSVSGKTITYTKNDGTTGTITTQDTNTDTKVTQTARTTDGSFPVLLRGTSAGTSTTTTTTSFGTGITANPGTGTLTATKFVGSLEGNATSATSATKATQDASGNVITSTYETKSDATEKLNEAKSYTDTKTSGLASTTVVDNKISTHNSSSTAHNDIRTLINDLKTVVNNFLDVDDTTTDQLSEVLTLINNNKGTLESLTTSKVNVSDIVNNLTTNSTSKVLSAAQGVAIKALIDALQTELDSHGHVIADVSGLQTALDGKAASSHGTHVSFDSTNKPKMDGTAAFGTSSKVSRADHVHPTDTSRASQSSLDSHTGNTTSHITSTERTNWNAAKTHADSAHAPSNAQANQNAFSNVKVGDTTIAADTTTDTLELVGSNLTITPDATNDKVTIAVANGSTSTKGIVKLSSSTSSTSTSLAATPSAVKSAYDLANTAKTNAATAQTKADDAYTLAESKVDSLSDLGITATADELNYVDGVTSNIQTQLDGKSASGHTHNYAGSSSAGGAATSANKVNKSLTVKLNSGTTEGTDMFTFNGSAAKSVNITPSAIGASASGHNHDDKYYTESEMDSKLSGKANTSHGNHVPTTQTANNATFLRNDNTWQKVTPANIGAAASSHTHTVANITDLTATATELNYMDGVTSNVQEQLDGKAASSHGTHVSFTTTTPKVAGTAAVGSATTVSRSDHVHPAQTTVSGNAGSATKLATARAIDGVNFDGSAAITHYGTCSTAAATAAKTVSLTGFTLVTGARVCVKFTVTNTASSPTLNVNSTGAKAIMYRGSAISAGYLAANRVYEFVYDGTDWELVGDINTDSNTKNTAGSTDSSSKLFLIGATSQAANPQTYSHDTAYVGTDGCLYSGGTKVSVEGHNHAASNITSGTLSSDRLPTVPVSKGGTGATTAAGALTNLGLTATAAELNYMDGVTSNVQTQINTLNNSLNEKVLKSGDTMTGTLEVNAPIFGYNFKKNKNAPAFVLDKQGENYTGIGSNGESDTILFAPVSVNDINSWVSDYYQKWRFQGSILSENGFYSADQTMSIFPYANNEVNFGGTTESSTIYFGYRGINNKPIPTNFVFGGVNGSATITAANIPNYSYSNGTLTITTRS